MNQRAQLQEAILVAPGRLSPASGAPSLKSIVDAASELVPVLRKQAFQTETERRLSAAMDKRFHEAGFYRLMQPARFGGYEYGFTALLDVISELGRGCPSAAWAGSLGAIHGWLVANFPPQAQEDVWGKDPRAIMCGSYAPVAKAEPVDGGYRIQGKWRFASNVDNSQWAVLGVQFPPKEEGAPPGAGFLLVPRADWTIEDDWQVAGQAGTGGRRKADLRAGAPQAALRRGGFGQAPGQRAAQEPDLQHSVPFRDSALPGGAAGRCGAGLDRTVRRAVRIAPHARRRGRGRHAAQRLQPRAVAPRRRRGERRRSAPRP
jgi:hypothetical protein